MEEVWTYDGTLGDGLAPWTGRAILLVDLDAFFASVEQLDHPEWRGKPVIVGGDADKRGVVSTCSYEARAFGVRSAMPSMTARRLCPQAIWTHGHFDRYREMSAAVMDILRDESPLLQQVSIDEAFLDVSPGRYNNEHPLLIANRIQKRVAALGITCSIGLATSKTVAKIASDMDKPRGITVVWPGREEGFLAPLALRKLPGIGGQTAAKLEEMGIRDLGTLAKSDPSVLNRIFGVNTMMVLDRCRGIDDSPISTDHEVKSVSNEMTFSTDLVDEREIREAIKMLAAKVGRRLRAKGMTGSTVILKLKYDDLSVRTARKPLPMSTDLEDEFIPQLMGLVPELWQPGCKVRLLGVGISGFQERSEQLSLLDEDDDISALPLPDREEKRRLAKASDAIRERFGDDLLLYGRDLRFRGKGSGTPKQNVPDD
ncbi:MAG: DNA polymerase IV [Coriobacteriales bacterium]|nr:DNA polymerase IV [Coriobacteriales bacterium]